MGQAIGVAIEFVGTTFTMCGINGQKHALMKEDAKEEGAKRSSWYSNWRWACAFLVFVIGQILEFVAQGFGSQALCSSVSNVSLVTNAVIARLVFMEKLGLKYAFSMVCILIGAALAAYTAPDLPAAADDYKLHKLIALAKGEQYLIYFFLCVAGRLPACARQARCSHSRRAG